MKKSNVFFTRGHTASLNNEDVPKTMCGFWPECASLACIGTFALEGLRCTQTLVVL
jgi:hypothetical protein